MKRFPFIKDDELYIYELQETKESQKWLYEIFYYYTFLTTDDKEEATFAFNCFSQEYADIVDPSCTLKIFQNENKFNVMYYPSILNSIIEFGTIPLDQVVEELKKRHEEDVISFITHYLSSATWKDARVYGDKIEFELKLFNEGSFPLHPDGEFFRHRKYVVQESHLMEVELQEQLLQYLFPYKVWKKTKNGIKFLEFYKDDLKIAEENTDSFNRMLSQNRKQLKMLRK